MKIEKRVGELVREKRRRVSEREKKERS